MTTIYLIRHAQADGNLYRRCQAWYDSLVTETGYQQIAALEDRFRDTHFDAVYSSDLFRTMTTARAIFRSHNLPLFTDPDLREINCGRWEDLAWGELLQTERESLLAFWRCDPSWQVDGSETFAKIQMRFDSAVKRIAEKHPNQTIAIFAHGCIIRASLAHWFGLPADRIRDIPHGDNTSVAKLEYSDKTIQVCQYNDISHLSGDLARAPHPAAETDEATAIGIEKASVYFKSVNSSDQEFLALLGTKIIGRLELYNQNETDSNIGSVSLLSLEPDFLTYAFTAQMVGQAVSIFRARGCRCIQVHCSNELDAAHKHYRKLGFRPLYSDEQQVIFEKYIGTDNT